MVVLYHYTTRSGAEGIKRTQTINCAQRHAHHGEGVYFTSLPPQSYTKHEVAKNNYRIGAASNMHHMDYVVEVEFSHADVERCPEAQRNLWRYPDNPVDLRRQTRHQIYKVEN